VIGPFMPLPTHYSTEKSTETRDLVDGTSGSRSRGPTFKSCPGHQLS
jgi:hypothetical protein